MDPWTLGIYGLDSQQMQEFLPEPIRVSERESGAGRQGQMFVLMDFVSNQL